MVRAPFVYMGNKQKVGEVVWRWVPECRGLIDPFAGSLGTWLSCPWPERIGYVLLGDLNGRLVNLWRAVAQDPTVLEEACSLPVDSLGVNAPMPVVDVELLRRGVRFYDREVAVLSLFQMGRRRDPNKETSRSLAFERSGRQVMDKQDARELAARLDPSRVVVNFQPWEDTLRPGNVNKLAKSGAPVLVWLDPPYRDHEHLYQEGETGMWQSVNEWAVAHAQDARLRVVVAGHEGDGDALLAAGYREHAWVRNGAANGSVVNKDRERLWLSPTIDQAPTLLEIA